MSSNEALDELEIIERYILLLLGILDRPIPSSLHLQKELFVLTQANPKIERIFNFEKHYYGPYSQDLDELVKEPLYYKETFNLKKNGEISITERGRKLFNEIIKKYSENIRFSEMLAMMKMTRELYDKLTFDELLLLIYITYGEFKEKSKVSKKILSRENRNKLAHNLFKKGVITETRYNELVNYSNEN